MPPGIGYRPTLTPHAQAPGYQRPPNRLAQLLAMPGLRGALMATGSSLLQSRDVPGSTLGGSLGHALPVGMQAYQQGQQQSQYEAALQNAPPELQQLLRILGPGRGAPLLAQMMTQGPERQIVPPGAAVVQGGEEVYRNVPEPSDDRPTNVREFEFVQSLSPEQQAAYKELHGRAPLVSNVVETGDRAANAASQALGGNAVERLTVAADAAGPGLDMIQNVRIAEDILADPAFKDVTGPASEFKTLLERFGDDPQGRRLAAMWDVLTSDVVLQKVTAIRGPLSEKELAFIQKASAADRDMTVEELEAGIGLVKRVAERDLETYLFEVEAFDPSAFGVAPEQMGQYEWLAVRARYMLTGELPDDPEAAARLIRGR